MFAEWRRLSGEYDAIVRLGARVPDDRRTQLHVLQVRDFDSKPKPGLAGFVRPLDQAHMSPDRIS